MMKTVPHSTRLARSPRSAFTLIELLVVVAIIAILVGMVVGLAGYSSKKSATGKALAELERIKNALEEYRMTKGGYYDVSITAFGSAYNSFTNALSSIDPKLVFVDPWGRPYQYVPSKLPNQPVFTYRLWSQGPSATTADDDVDSAAGKY